MNCVSFLNLRIQLNLCTTASMGRKKVAIVERVKQESVYGVHQNNKVAVVERWPLWKWPLVKVQLYQLLLINFDCLINYIAFTSER